MEFYTIGVFNSTEQEYFNKLLENKIDTFCDIRQRRGVRGSTYAFVNSNRLQKKLIDLNIRYEYITGLTPTEEVRAVQKEIDAQRGEQNRDRNSLGGLFIDTYKDKILSKFNFSSFFENLAQNGANRVVLFCVEEDPEACHRSIISNKLEELGYKIKHL